jgi:glycerol-3-phosphate dehydrogenase
VDRVAAIEQLAARQFDLLVIGGGIVGAGIAEAATAHGLAVALVDRGDFASATSSGSSKLIHGGLRYLQMGDIGLVREAHQERRYLMNVVAPHLVERLPFRSHSTPAGRTARSSSAPACSSTRRSPARA